MQKRISAKRGPASLSYIHSGLVFFVENRQKKMKKSGGTSQFFKTFYGKNHETV